MAASLPAGVQYGLSSEQNKENKEVVILKLTDSALKAIDDYIKARDRLATKPTIQFLPGNEGNIVIPTGTEDSKFHFSINSNAEMEGQGSFECVKSGGPRRLESCGPLPWRMRVQANDDSYEATKDRMARTVAAEQSKCTRVIKPNQTDIGRRVKVRSTHPLYSTSAPAPAPQLAERPEYRPERPDHRPDRPEHRPERPDHRPERPDHRPERPDHRPERPDHRPERPDHRPERPDNRPERPDHRPERPEQRAERSEHRAERPEYRQERQERPVPQPAPRPAPAAPPPANHQRVPNNPDLTRRSIKERLIQLLALKPFKKPELYARLTSEGIKEKERGVVNKILPQIGTLKDNCYHLRRHMWNDVNEDWPFYTEDEKHTLKRRKPQNLTPPVSSDSTNSLSPRASPNKRAQPVDEPPAAKKQRISHYRRPDQRPAGGSPSSGYATGGSGASSGERHASDNEDDRSSGVKKDNGYTLNFNTIKELCPSAVPKTNGFRNSPPVEQTNISNVKDITNREPEPLENTELAPVPEDNVTELENFMRLYPPITNSSTRRAYKKLFTELYAEYREMYGRIARVAELFTHLETQLKRAQPHSPQHQSIEQRIVEEYKRVRNDAAYQHERRRVEYLHRKLTHIKQCVQHYDHMRSLKPERVATASTTQAY